MRVVLAFLSCQLLAACATTEMAGPDPAVPSKEVSVAEAAPVPPTVFAPNCVSAKYRQFDFWIGEWVVTDPDGQVVGENRIESILAGCALKETWSSAVSPHRGNSFNMYDAGRDVWHQTWVDNGGTLLRIEGQYEGGVMSLEGELPGTKGRTNRQRIRWTANPDGTVRQHWQTRPVGEPEWKTVFDGLYTRK